ncbi:MAG TPA: hypothetical protein VGR22_10160 [Thermomicrobiales bacterium]|nr:hypothetical protein [Thermomicrobiales bacterium]
MTRAIVYVDSAEEQVAYLIARFGPQGAWSVREQRVATLDNGASVERASLQTSQGDVEVEFRDATPASISLTGEVTEVERTGTMDDVMERAAAFAAANPPHHPGSLARFPVPVEHYGVAVGVPFPILAVDALGRRGLFAPPRMAVVSWDTCEPVGAREFEDFDPDNWPPRRLSDWPAPQAARLTHEQLQATIQRFSACWSRVIDAWFKDRDWRDDVVFADAREALRWRGVLDPEAMQGVYRQMNQRFDAWVQALASAR